MHSIMDPTVGTFAGSIVELTDVLTEDILIPTEDILIPLRIPTASDNILVRFTVGLTNGCAIVLAEVANRLVVRNKLARQPHLSFPKIISARSSGAVRTRLA